MRQFRHQYVHVPDMDDGYWQVSGSPHKASYCFNVDAVGTYRLRAQINASNYNNNSFFVQVDGNPPTGYLWDTDTTSGYESDYVADRNGADPFEVVLPVGDHTSTSYLREDGTILDTLELEFVSSSTAFSSGASPKQLMKLIYLPLFQRE